MKYINSENDIVIENEAGSAKIWLTDAGDLVYSLSANQACDGLDIDNLECLRELIDEISVLINPTYEESHQSKSVRKMWKKYFNG
jgi:hypothetical protein